MLSASNEHQRQMIANAMLLLLAVVSVATEACAMSLLNIKDGPEERKET